MTTITQLPPGLPPHNPPGMPPGMPIFKPPPSPKTPPPNSSSSPKKPVFERTPPGIHSPDRPLETPSPGVLPPPGVPTPTSPSAFPIRPSFSPTDTPTLPPLLFPLPPMPPPPGMRRSEPKHPTLPFPPSLSSSQQKHRSLPKPHQPNHLSAPQSSVFPTIVPSDSATPTQTTIITSTGTAITAHFNPSPKAPLRSLTPPPRAPPSSPTFRLPPPLLPSYPSYP